MKLLIDESLSFRVARLLVGSGHDAIHVGDLDLLGAPDTAVMSSARDGERWVVAADTDFGELLAIGRHPGPSVILRQPPRRPEEQVALVVSVLNELADELEAGAIVVLRGGRVRVRALPFASQRGGVS